jgi:FKBP-type peptidyl-prolyl cis-trans isomerase FkpA
MKRSPRLASTALAVSLLALAGCNKTGDQANITTDNASVDANAMPGLPTEKARDSYMVGMAMAKQLEPIKDELDMDLLVKAMRTTLAGEKTLMTDQQATMLGKAFGEKMRAKVRQKMVATAKMNGQAGEVFLTRNSKKPGVKTTASGLQYMVLSEGKGPKPQPTDTVRVNYKGSLLDGKVFDDSAQHGGPAKIPLQAVVPGWREGVTLMPVGSKYRLWIPGAIGYGDKVPPGAAIGPNATLVFDVELLDIVKAD